MFRLNLFGFLTFLFLSLPLTAGAREDAKLQTKHVRAELMVHAPEGIKAGKQVILGLAIEHQPGWHTYWKNPGDSGLPTSFEWTLPNGFSAGEIQWPTPVRLPLGPLMNFGYVDKLLLPVALTVPASFHAEDVVVHLNAQWLVCKEICLPESGKFTLRLKTADPYVRQQARFASALARRPVAVSGISAHARVQGTGMALAISGLPAALQGKPMQFYPENVGVFEYAAPLQQRWDGNRLSMTVALSPQRSESPSALRFVLVGATGTAVHASATVEGGWPGGAAAVPNAPSPVREKGATPPGSTLATTSFGYILLLAFAGGLFLNLMPCVFPVLSLKVVGFAAHADNRQRVVAGGIAYTVGVISTFVALAGLLLILRGAGAQIGWGFQLQSPLFITALAVLFTLIGLNLAGMYELGSVLPDRLVTMRASHPVLDDFLSGVLAVLVASPCTGPFMGAAVGAALSQSGPGAVALFATLGIGMAAPYLAASLFPAVARLLPRPGVWMLRFKMIMAFPMFATVVWLIWVLGHQVGIDGAAASLGLLLAVAFAAWAFSTPAKRGARIGLGASGLILVASVSTWALPQLSATAGDAPAEQKNAREQHWQAWSPEAVETARGKGRPVFIDFTAAWCVTCQYNKRVALSDERVLRDFAERGVVLLRADWTRRDPEITRQLALLGRSGVPVYAWYGAREAQPRLLSEMLTVDEVRAALRRP